MWLLQKERQSQYEQSNFDAATEEKTVSIPASNFDAAIEEDTVSHDHSLRTLFIAPITDSKHVLTGDGQNISAMA